MRHGLGERARKAQRHVAAERIAIAGRVLGGDVPIDAGDGHPDRSSIVHQARQPRTTLDAFTAEVDLRFRQIAHLAQHVVKFIGGARPAPVSQQLQFQLEIGQRTGVEQLAELLGAEQVAQQIAIERERCGPPFGQRAVALVHERRYPVEQQALRERRGLCRVDADHADRATSQLTQHLAQGGQIEDVLQAFARGLQQHRERRILGRDREQVGRTLALLPQRCALIRPPTRQQQRTRRALTETRREQRRLRQRGHHELVDVVGIDDQIGQRQFIGRFRQAQDDAIVGVHRLHRDVVALHQPTLDRHRPRCMDRHTERAEDAHPPIANLVTETFNDDGAVVGHDPRGLRLLLQVQHHVLGGKRIERVLGHQLRERACRRHRPGLALERAEGTTELERAAGSVAVPEGHLPRFAGGRRDHHSLERDVLDAPGAGPQ